jgi:hypothetical protein
MNIIGDVNGKTCVLVDDIVDTAGTLCAAAAALKERGARKVVAYCVHPVLSGAAISNIEGSQLDQLVVTNTLPLRPQAPGLRQDPPALGRRAAGRNHSPHRLWRVGEFVVRGLIFQQDGRNAFLRDSRIAGNGNPLVAGEVIASRREAAQHNLRQY